MGVKMAADDAASIAEHRLAVVMNGGVSLAVWMGGVAYELDLLRRASQQLAVPEVSAGTAYKLWAAALTGLGKKVRIDVIAGTSAGGLNGVLLASAIARGASMATVRQLWIHAAQVSPEGLLQPQAGGARSLFNGDYFRDRIDDALANMAVVDDDPGAGQPVDLTVTATALNAAARQVYDSYLVPFREADHRRRYGFRRTQPGLEFLPGPGGGAYAPTPAVNHFDDSETLASAARASAAYPAAFVPQCETDGLAARRTWPTWPQGNQPTWLADGGILDNSPFGPVLDAITAQPVVGTWHRTLCYIVPAAGEAERGRELGAAAISEADPPSWLSVVTAAFGLPREADFRDDVEDLHATLSGGRASLDVDRFSQLLASDADRSTAIELTNTGLPLYRASQAAAAVYRLRQLLSEQTPTGYLDAATTIDATSIAGPSSWLPSALPGALNEEWHWGLDAATRVIRLMLRSLRIGTAALDPVRRALDTNLREVAAVRRVVETSLGATTYGDGPVSPQAAGTALDAAYGSAGVPEALGAIVADAVTVFAAEVAPIDGTGVPFSPLAILQAALCVEAANGIGATPATPDPGPILDFARIGISRAPGVVEHAILADQPTGPSPNSNDILYGTRLNHFAGFGDPDWRKWDWLWGRLHAVAQFGMLLGLSPNQVDEIAQAVLDAEGQPINGLPQAVQKVLTTGLPELTAHLRDNGVAAAALDGVFELVDSGATTAPPLPRPVLAGGRLAADLLSRDPGHLTAGRRILRWLAWWRRRRLWDRVT